MMSNTARYENVEILRGVAACSVMWFHLTNGNPNFLENTSLLKESGTFGYLGVQLFFVISGFIIPYSMFLRNYKIKNDGLNFLFRRIIRIEPVYIISAIFTIILQMGSAMVPGTHASIPGAEWGTNLLMHLAYLPPWFDIPWLSPVYWSLAIEFQYYLFMLFFVPLLLSSQRMHIYLFLIGTVILSLLINNEKIFLPYLPIFGLGFIRFLVVRRILHWAEIGAWAIVFFSLCWVMLDYRQALAAALALGVLFLPLKRPIPIFSFLGIISYLLYLVHVPVGGRVINLAVRFHFGPIMQLIATVSAILVSICFAYIYWRFIEKPSARLSRSIGDKSNRVQREAAFQR